MCPLWIWSHHRRRRSTWQKGVEMALFLENWLTQGCIVDHLYLLELDVRDFGVCGSNHLPSLLSYDKKLSKKSLVYLEVKLLLYIIQKILIFLWLLEISKSKTFSIMIYNQSRWSSPFFPFKLCWIWQKQWPVICLPAFIFEMNNNDGISRPATIILSPLLFQNHPLLGRIL